jgi:hypothetical protein
MVIEYGLLSERLVSLLLPLLPKAGKTISSAAAGALTEGLAADTADAVRSLWERLMTRVRGEPRAQGAIEDAATNPDDSRTAAALSLALERLLREDDKFAQEMERLVARAERSAIVQAANVTVQGDDAVVQMGKYNINIRNARDVRMSDEH